MGVSFPREPDVVRGNLVRTATQHGFTSLDRFIGAFIDVFGDSFSQLYTETYNLDPQTRIDTATGEYLDGYGVALDEPRSARTPLQDLALNNAYITTSNGQRVTRYTPGSVPLLIPNGTAILDASGTTVLSTIDTVFMDSERAYIRVVGTGGNQGDVNAGTYRLGTTITSLVGARFGSTQGQSPVLDVPTLNVQIQQTIPANTGRVSDSDYRFVLYSKGRSNNLANKARVDLVLRDTRIARFVIEEFTSGSSSFAVYVEPVVGLLQKPLEQSVRNAIVALMPYGTVIHVARMVPSYMNFDIAITLDPVAQASDRNLVRDTAIAETLSFVSEIPSGDIYEKSSHLALLNSLNLVGKAELRKVTVNGLTLHESQYDARDIEFLYTTENGVRITFV